MAALDDGVLHVALAHELDALQAFASSGRLGRPTTPTSASRRTSADSSAAPAAAGAYRNDGIYNYTIAAITTATNLVAFSIILWGISRTMDLSIFGIRIPGLLFWVAILYACFATGVMQLIGRSLSRLFFRQQAVEANFRFDLARIREYSEQIALLKGEEREIDRAGRVFGDVFTTVQRIIRVRTLLNSFLQFYVQISAIIPYVVVAPFYFVVKRSISGGSTRRRTLSATSTAR